MPTLKTGVTMQNMALKNPHWNAQMEVLSLKAHCWWSTYCCLFGANSVLHKPPFFTQKKNVHQFMYVSTCGIPFTSLSFECVCQIWVSHLSTQLALIAISLWSPVLRHKHRDQILQNMCIQVTLMGLLLMKM